MLQWLKNHFIPHPGNGHRPHILHHENIHRIIGFVIFVEVFAFLIPSVAVISNADTGNILPSILTELTNHERTQLNLPTLTVNPILNEAAQEKANDMAANHYFAHTSPEGKTPWFWLKKVNYSYSYAGENLAINFTDSKDLTTAWMNSPTHRANIVKANYTQIGTGVAEGTYNGNPTIFVAQVFGNPAAAAAPAPKEEDQKPNTVAVTPSTPTILGAETIPTKTPVVAVQQPVEVAPVVAAEPAIVIPASAQETHPSFMQKLFASPRNTTNAILFVIIGLVALAVFLNIGIKISHHHPDLIMNGVMAIAVIGCVFVVNNYISKSNITLLDSVQYSNDRITS